MPNRLKQKGRFSALGGVALALGLLAAGSLAPVASAATPDPAPGDAVAEAESVASEDCGMSGDPDCRTARQKGFGRRGGD